MGLSKMFVLSGPLKVHETRCPFRHSVSSANKYNYNLASYLVGILLPISTNQYTVEDLLLAVSSSNIKHVHQ